MFINMGKETLFSYIHTRKVMHLIKNLIQRWVFYIIDKIFFETFPIVTKLIELF